MGIHHSPGPSSPEPATVGSRRGSRRRAIRLTLFLMFVVVPITGIGLAFFLLRTDPAHWKQHETFLRETTPTQIQALARSAQQRLERLCELQDDTRGSRPEAIGRLVHGGRRIDPAGTRIDAVGTIFLNHDELQAVLMERFDQWLSARGYEKPEEITDPMILVRDGKLVMAFRLRMARFSQVLSGIFQLRIEPDGHADLTLDRFLAGRLPVPAAAISSYLRNKAPVHKDRAEKVGTWLAKLQHVRFKPVLEMPHRRRVRVLAYDLEEGGIQLTLRIQDHRTYRATNEVLAMAALTGP